MAKLTSDGVARILEVDPSKFMDVASVCRKDKVELSPVAVRALMTAAYASGFPLGDALKEVGYTKTYRSWARSWRPSGVRSISRELSVKICDWAESNGIDEFSTADIMNEFRVGYIQAADAIRAAKDSGFIESLVGFGHRLVVDGEGDASEDQEAPEGEQAICESTIEDSRYSVDDIFDAVVGMVSPDNGITSGNLEVAMDFKKALKAFYDVSK